jgi:glucosamine 6-phosphate synthetase-like amidotransferase/phosphosugar isomerase protein
MALWLTSLRTPSPISVIAVPAGIVGDPSFPWADGDLLLAISSSGEFRDVVSAARNAHRSVAITADPTSALARHVGASAIVQLEARRAVTHTQAYCASVLAVLTLWADVTHDAGLAQGLRDTPALVASALDRAEQWAALQTADLAHPEAAVAFGTGPGWTAALEAALLLKEVARIPAEGVETREGATSAMYGLGMDHLVLTIGSEDDSLLEEAEAVCATTGATIVRAPGGETGDSRLAPILSFPAVLALAISLGTRSGIDVDHPSWASAYATTSRTTPPVGGSLR